MMDEVFSDILSSIRSLSTRIAKFETWEPASPQDVSAHVYLSSNQAVNTGAYHQILFDAELYDTSGIHSGGTFTITEDGKYYVKTSLNSGFVGGAYIRIYKSATEYIEASYFTTTDYMSVSGIMLLDEGDTLIVDLAPTVNMTVIGSALVYDSFFQIKKLV